MRQELCHVVMRFSRIGSFRASAFSPARPKLGGKPPPSVAVFQLPSHEPASACRGTGYDDRSGSADRNYEVAGANFNIGRESSRRIGR